MKTATITLPEPTISKSCKLSPADAAWVLENLKREMANFITAYTVRTEAYPYFDRETLNAYYMMRGAMWMAAYCDLIDWDTIHKISSATLDLMARREREAASAT
jgi:hypothetical protein